MAVEVKEAIDSGNSSSNETSASWERTWHVLDTEENPASNVVAGWGVETYHAFDYIPVDRSDWVVIDGRAVHPISFSAKRVDLRMVNVTVSYGESESGRGGVDEEEESRRNALYRPYDEELDLMGEESQVSSSPITNEPIGVGDNEATIYEKKQVWSFSVNTPPMEVWYNLIGKCNDDYYPPPGAATDHWRYPPYRLLYLGSRGTRIPNPTDDLSTPGVWKMQPTFLYSPEDWRYVTWTMKTSEMALGKVTGDEDFDFDLNDLVDGDGFYYYPPGSGTPAPVPDNELPVLMIKLPIWVKNLRTSDGRVIAKSNMFSTKIRTAADFTQFGLDWS